MPVDESDSKPIQKKLTGWKMIGRHLGRSQRAVQFWEEERGLPIHRIPGGRGQTVFAYAAELDAWMNSREPGAVVAVVSQVIATIDAPSPLPVPAALPPGILVLPCESWLDNGPCRAADSFCQQLIVRLSAVQPVRVLSWTTSRCQRHIVESIESTARRTNVRYVVETTIDRGVDALHVDVRVIDAEIDQIMLADRFVVTESEVRAGFADIAEAVALHFALLHAGALVEPMCLGDMQPAIFLAYLAAARCFFDDANASGGRALAILDGVLSTSPNFDGARALRGLALMQTFMAERDTDVLAEARAILATLEDRTSARVTAAFLGAAINRLAGSDGDTPALPKALLRWIPPSVVRHGRLYERRSSLPRANEAGTTRRNSDDRHDHVKSDDGRSLLDDLLRELMAAHRCQDRVTDLPVRAVSGVYPRAVPSPIHTASLSDVSPRKMGQ